MEQSWEWRGGRQIAGSWYLLGLSEGFVCWIMPWENGRMSYVIYALAALVNLSEGKKVL